MSDIGKSIGLESPGLPRFVIVSPRSEGSRNMQRGYVGEISREARSRGGQGVLRCEPKELMRCRLYAIGVVVEDGSVRFAAAVRVSTEENKVHFKGAVVARRFRSLGLMRNLVAAVRVSEFEHDPSCVHVAQIRGYANGQVNLRSMRAFEASGFRFESLGQYRLRMDYTDKHLAAGSTNGEITQLHMTAHPQSIDAAYRILRPAE